MKDKKSDLIPRGIAYTVVPEEYLKAFPYNDLEKITKNNKNKQNESGTMGSSTSVR